MVMITFSLLMALEEEAFGGPLCSRTCPKTLDDENLARGTVWLLPRGVIELHSDWKRWNKYYSPGTLQGLLMMTILREEKCGHHHPQSPSGNWIRSNRLSIEVAKQILARLDFYR